MDGRAFLGSAQHLLGVDTEANRRSAAGRLYLALLHEGNAALERWGFPRPAQDDIHSFVLSRFNSAPNLDLLRVADALKQLRALAEVADYALASPGVFVDAIEISRRQILAQVTVDLLEQIDNDTARRTAAVTDLRARWP
jgi:hypothetical protein